MREGWAFTQWDVRLVARAFALAAIATVLAFLLTALTDEGGVSSAVRLARCLPAVPVAGAVGAGLAFRGARTRGEALALEALGRTPGENARGAIGGAGLAVTLVACFLAAIPSADVSGFFPSAFRGETLRREDGAFVDVRRTFRVEDDGLVILFDPAGAEVTALRRDAVPPFGRAAAILTVVLAGWALAILATRSARFRMADGVATASCVGASLVSFHAAALGRVPALVAVLPCAALLTWVGFRYVPRS